MAKQSMDHQHLEIVDEEPHPGYFTSGLDSYTNTNINNSTDAVTASIGTSSTYPVHQLHFDDQATATVGTRPRYLNGRSKSLPVNSTAFHTPGHNGSHTHTRSCRHPSGGASSSFACSSPRSPRYPSHPTSAYSPSVQHPLTQSFSSNPSPFFPRDHHRPRNQSQSSASTLVPNFRSSSQQHTPYSLTSFGCDDYSEDQPYSQPFNTTQRNRNSPSVTHPSEDPYFNGNIPLSPSVAAPYSATTDLPRTRPRLPHPDEDPYFEENSREYEASKNRAGDWGQPPTVTDGSRATSSSYSRWKALLICTFTGMGGILFGYDTGYINGVMAMPYFENLYLGHSLRPQAVPVTDKCGVPILDREGKKISGPISINSLKARLPAERDWLGLDENGMNPTKVSCPQEDGDDSGSESDDERCLIVEAFRYEDSQAPPWIRAEQHEQPFFVLTDLNGTARGDMDPPTPVISKARHGHHEPKRKPVQPVWFRLPARDKSLIVGLLSAGTCMGSLLGSDAADYLGRRVALMIACVIFIWGIINQTVSEHMDLLGRGRFETGLGMGMVSTVIILYISEISPAPLRGLLIAWYQLCVTIGLLVSSCVNLGTRRRWDTGSFRIPISLQIAWAVTLGAGLFFLPESPRWLVKMGRDGRARDALARLRCKDKMGVEVREELNAIITAHEQEVRMATPGSDTFMGSWAACFRGPWSNRGSNLRRTILGASIQMFQQISGINFIFYFGTAFFKQQRFHNVFLILVVMSAIHAAATVFSFALVNRLRRRILLFTGGIAMGICQLSVAAFGLVWKAKMDDDVSALNPMEHVPAWMFWSTMTGIGGYLIIYAVTWGPGAWILTGEIFPLQIRARGVGISMSTNWLWNTIISFATPVLVDTEHWDIGPGVFVIWGVACLLGALFTYLFVPETRGLTLEQVDMIFEVPARWSNSLLPGQKSEEAGKKFSDPSITTVSTTSLATSLAP